MRIKWTTHFKSPTQWVEQSRHSVNVSFLPVKKHLLFLFFIYLFLFCFLYFFLFLLVFFFPQETVFLGCHSAPLADLPWARDRIGTHGNETLPGNSQETLFKWTDCQQLMPNKTDLLGLSWLNFPGGISGKESACQCRRHEMWVRSLGWEDPLEEVMATHSSILAWRIPWT